MNLCPPGATSTASPPTRSPLFTITLFTTLFTISDLLTVCHSSVQRLSDSTFSTKWRKSAATRPLVISTATFRLHFFYKVEEVRSYQTFSHSLVQRLSYSTFSTKWRKSAATQPILSLVGFFGRQTCICLRLSAGAL